MAIPAKRFKVLSDETNVAAAKLSSMMGSDITNIGANELKMASSSMQTLIDSGLQAAKDAIKPEDLLGDTLSKYTRQVKGMLGSITDFTGIPKDLMDKFTDLIAPENPRLNRGLHELMLKCRGRGSGYGIGGKPYDVTMNCRSGTSRHGGLGTSSNCNAGNFNNLLSGLTGNKQKGFMQDKGSALRALMSMSGYGYGLGICGVFGGMRESSLLKELGLGDNEFSRAAGNLLGILGGSSNTRGWIDVAMNSAGLSPMLVNPSSISDLFINYAIPDTVKESGWLDLAEKTTGAVSFIKDDWNFSEVGDMFSIGELETRTQDLANVFETQLTNRSFGMDDLDFIPDDPMDFMFSSALSF